MILSRIEKYVVLSMALAASAGTSAQTGKSFSASSPSTDSVRVYASQQYRPHSFLRRLLMGSNYRDEWGQTVTLPVFHFSGSGFRIKDLGGGMQTKSLHLVDAHGKPWSLRTVNKEAIDDGLVPALRNRIGRNLSQDLISAAFPYAAPMAGEIAHAAGITAARPPVFYVAADTAFGPYQTFFSGSLCTLEERDTGFDSTDNSETLLKNIRSSKRYRIQQEVYLRARLLDMLIADWDRHADNWRWGIKDSVGSLYYYAVPRDRDWAFYKGGGLLPWLTQKTGSIPCLIPFTQKLKNVKRQSWKSWEMDREFTNALEAADWRKVIASFCAALSDDAIVDAVKVLPAAVYATEGETFVQKLKSRRDALPKQVMKYRRFLVQEAVVNGSNEAETFRVIAAKDSLKISVYETATQRLLYEKVFVAGETYVITLNGFGGDDTFDVVENVKSRIRLVINGGEGRNNYNIRGDIRHRINDTSVGSNEIINQSRATQKLK